MGDVRVFPFRVLRWQQCKTLSAYLTRFGSIGEQMYDEDTTLILCALQLARGVSPDRIRRFLKVLTDASNKSYAEEEFEELFSEAQGMSETEYFKECARLSPLKKSECTKPLRTFSDFDSEFIP